MSDEPATNAEIRAFAVPRATQVARAVALAASRLAGHATGLVPAVRWMIVRVGAGMVAGAEQPLVDGVAGA